MKELYLDDAIIAVYLANFLGVKYWTYHITYHGYKEGRSSKKITLYPSPYINKMGLATTRTSRGGRLVHVNEVGLTYRRLYIHPDSLPTFTNMPVKTKQALKHLDMWPLSEDGE